MSDHACSRSRSFRHWLGRAARPPPSEAPFREAMWTQARRVAGARPHSLPDREWCPSQPGLVHPASLMAAQPCSAGRQDSRAIKSVDQTKNRQLSTPGWARAYAEPPFSAKDDSIGRFQEWRLHTNALSRYIHRHRIGVERHYGVLKQGPNSSLPSGQPKTQQKDFWAVWMM